MIRAEQTCSRHRLVTKYFTKLIYLDQSDDRAGASSLLLVPRRKDSWST